MKKQNKSFIKLSLLFVFMALSFACGRISFSPENTNSTIQPKENLTSLEREIRDMQTANFKFVFVFKRKDDGAFDKEDRDYLRENRPSDANRWIATDDKKAFVAGSNFIFPPENLEILRKRFIIEDYSKPPEEIPAAINTNQN